MYLFLLSKRSLRTQISLLFGLLVAAIAVLGSVGFAEWISHDSQRESGRTLQLAAHNAAFSLAKGLQERAIETQVLADADDIWSKGLGSADARALLKRAQSRHRHTAWAGVASVQGTVMAATGNLLLGKSVVERPWFQEGLQHAFVGDVHKALLLSSLLARPPNNEPARFVDFSAPIHLNGQVIGVLGMHGSWDWTGETIESLLPPESERSGLEVLVFARNGELIYAPASSLQALQSARQRPRRSRATRRVLHRLSTGQTVFERLAPAYSCRPRTARAIWAGKWSPDSRLPWPMHAALERCGVPSSLACWLHLWLRY